MKAMQTVRGNLAANPVFFPERPDEDGTLMPARWSATILENRRVRDAQGGWTDDPAGPTAVSVNAYGNTAMTLARCDIRRGDPVVAAGTDVHAGAYLTREGAPAARLTLTAQLVCFDTAMLRRRSERAAENSRPFDERGDHDEHDELAGHGEPGPAADPFDAPAGPAGEGGMA